MEVGGRGVVDGRGGQRGGMQLCGGEGGRLGSGRLAGRIRRPRLTVALVVLGWTTWRLGQRTRRAGLRHRGTPLHT